ncbi:hypothetical protein Aeh1ORF250c [Aeromonas phage Aeh1]|uniref:Uncharacterized protein n=1 Tax=Aeromonas phage Aeh1 TaxID=2880362 RepID=Q76YI3_9CAUD|nr:hypothetical protein Aeh1p262 [Aeromonas phage Aeh1]AAQ17912.1 hypothetical protein Aeh1ORF250c [Aeromonas phage Aeh1]
MGLLDVFRNKARMFAKNSVNITVNGKTLVGKNVDIVGGKVMVDGEEVENSSKLVIQIVGDVEKLEVGAGDVEIKGNVVSVEVDAGGVVIGGDVERLTVECGDVRVNGKSGKCNVACGDLIIH